VKYYDADVTSTSSTALLLVIPADDTFFKLYLSNTDAASKSTNMWSNNSKHFTQEINFQKTGVYF
jgi:hypothetical protein